MANQDSASVYQELLQIRQNFADSLAAAISLNEETEGKVADLQATVDTLKSDNKKLEYRVKHLRDAYDSMEK